MNFTKFKIHTSILLLFLTIQVILLFPIPLNRGIQQTNNVEVDQKSDISSLNIQPNSEINGPLNLNSIGNRGNLESQDIGTILLLHSDPSNVGLVISMLNSYSITTVELNIVAYTPNLGDLTPYSLVIVWTNFAPFDRVTTGNILADYIDGGGYVIMATFSHTVPVSDIQGRFFGDGYSAFIKTGPWDQTRTYDGMSTHPIFAGVSSFQSTYPTEPVILAHDAILIASYTDNMPFVAIKDQVISMSAWIAPPYWIGNYDLILTNAIKYLLLDTVLVLYADTPSTADDIGGLLEPNNFWVHKIDASSSIPSISEISHYPVVITWTHSVNPSFDNVGFGNLLADYVDNNGSVIMMPYTYYQSPWSIEGRFKNELYSPFTYVTNSVSAKRYFGTSSHSMLFGVSGYNTSSAMLPELNSGAVSIANYDDGTLFVGMKGNVLGINSYIPNNLGGEIDQLLVNSFNFLSGNITTDFDSPIILSPEDLITEFGEADVIISWDIIETNPKNYTIERDGIEIESSIWLPGSPINIDISGLNIGIYNINLTVYDFSGNYAWDVVMVTVVDTNSPVIIGPEDLEVSQDELGIEIQWILQDLNPDSYTIMRNNTEIQSSTWVSDQIISVVVENLEVGLHIYSLTVTDGTGNIGTDELRIIILPPNSPSISGPADKYFVQGDINQRITWYISDNNPTFYILEVNQQMITNSTWIGLPFIEIPLQNYIAGHYNFTLTLFDNSNNVISDTVLAQIFSSSPQTSNPIPTSSPTPSVPQNVFFGAIAAVSVLSIFMIIRRVRGP